MLSDFERNVLPHLHAAYNLARWLVRDSDLAQDVVQEAMVRALKYQSGLRDNAKPWLLQIVRNAAYAAIAARQAKSTALLEKDSSIDPADDPFSALERKDGVRHLNERLAALSPELRECLVLRELEDLSYKEIAQVTGVPIGTVMSRLWRARRTLLEPTT